MAMLTGAVTRQKSVIHAEVMGMFTSHTGERLVLKCLDIIRHAAAELVIQYINTQFILQKQNHAQLLSLS